MIGNAPLKPAAQQPVAQGRKLMFTTEVDNWPVDVWENLAAPPAPVYTASQVEQIRRDAVRDALGAAAEACEAALIPRADVETSLEGAYNMALDDASSAIRALMPKDAAERVAAAGGSGLPELLEKFDGVPDQSGRVVGVMPKEDL